MKKSIKMQIKTDLMSTLENNYSSPKYSSASEWLEYQRYRFDIDEYNKDEETTKCINEEYELYLEKIDYKNYLIDKLCEYIEKI